MMDQAVVDPEVLALSDEALSEFMTSAQEDNVIGVRFDPRGRIYTYISPPCEVGDRVLVPGSWFNPEPQAVRVVVLNPPVPPGVALKRVLEVLG